MRIKTRQWRFYTLSPQVGIEPLPMAYIPYTQGMSPEMMHALDLQENVMQRMTSSGIECTGSLTHHMLLGEDF